jgi:hypothetical protein
MFSMAVYVRAERCGVRMTLSRPNSGKSGGGGSGQKTSRAAPSRLHSVRNGTADEPQVI